MSGEKEECGVDKSCADRPAPVPSCDSACYAAKAAS